MDVERDRAASRLSLAIARGLATMSNIAGISCLAALAIALTAPGSALAQTRQKDATPPLTATAAIGGAGHKPKGMVGGPSRNSAASLGGVPRPTTRAPGVFAPMAPAKTPSAAGKPG